MVDDIKDISYEELYYEYYKKRNMKAKEYRESKQNDNHFMDKLRKPKLTWYYNNKDQINNDRNIKEIMI